MHGQQNVKTYFMVTAFFFFENRAIYEIIWKKYCKARQATDINTVHALRTLDN